MTAEGQAKVIAKIQEAASSWFMDFLAIRGLDALEKASDGQATKTVIPVEMQGIASISATIKEIIS